jgi:hypothetical protein
MAVNLIKSSRIISPSIVSKLPTFHGLSTSSGPDDGAKDRP